MKLEANPYAGIEKGKGIKASEWALQNGTDIVLVREEFKNKGPLYALSNAGVSIRKTDAKSKDEAVSAAVDEVRSES